MFDLLEVYLLLRANDMIRYLSSERNQGGVESLVDLPAHVLLAAVLEREWFTLIGRGTSRLCSDWLDLDVGDASSRHPKPPTRCIPCLSLCLYGVRALYNRSFQCTDATLMIKRHSERQEMPFMALESLRHQRQDPTNESTVLISLDQ